MEKHFLAIAEEAVSELRHLSLETKELLEARCHGVSSGNVERGLSLNQVSSLHNNDTEEYTLSADLTNPFEADRRHPKSKYLKSTTRSSQRSTGCSPK